MIDTKLANPEVRHVDADLICRECCVEKPPIPEWDKHDPVEVGPRTPVDRRSENDTLLGLNLGCRSAQPSSPREGERSVFGPYGLLLSFYLTGCML